MAGTGADFGAVQHHKEEEVEAMMPYHSKIELSCSIPNHVDVGHSMK